MIEKKKSRAIENTRVTEKSLRDFPDRIEAKVWHCFFDFRCDNWQSDRFHIYRENEWTPRPLFHSCRDMSHFWQPPNVDLRLVPGFSEKISDPEISFEKETRTIYFAFIRAYIFRIFHWQIGYSISMWAGSLWLTRPGYRPGNQYFTQVHGCTEHAVRFNDGLVRADNEGSVGLIRICTVSWEP